MATCKKCGKPIADGMEYCAECNGARTADESYLDSLLSSVSSNTTNPLTAKARRPQTASAVPTERAVPRRQAPTKKIDTGSYNILSDSNDDAFLDDLFDTPDLPDFPAAEFKEEAAVVSQALVPEDDDLMTPPEDVIASGNTIDDSDALEMLLGPQEQGTVEEAPPAEDILTEEYPEETASGAAEMSEEDSLLADLLDSVGEDTAEGPEPAEDPIAALDEAFAIAEEGEAEQTENIDFFNSDASPEDIEAAMSIPSPEGPDAPLEADTDVPAPDEEPELPAEEAQPDIPPAEERIASAGDFATNEDGEPILIPSEIPGTETSSKKSKVQVVEETGAAGGDEDILEFWNNLNNESPNGDAVTFVESDGGPQPAQEETSQLSPEEQAEQDELAALLSGLPTGGEGEDPGTVEAPAEKKETKKKKGFFARIFGNVKEELSEEELEERKQAALDKLDRDEEAAAKAKVDKEEAKKKKAEEAAEAKKAKAAAAEEAKKKKEAAKKEKADKKAELRKALVEEIEENEGRINKIGASFVFLVFGAMLAFIAIGTSIYSYRIAIQEAEKDFNDARKNLRQDEVEQAYNKFEEAYNDIYGIDVKEEDQELYDRIMVVNYINTQLLAYLHYTGLEMENEALDALLKGLRRYEKFVHLAQELDVKEDLDRLRDEIYSTLNSKYGLSEEQADEIVASETQELYSRAVRDVVEKLSAQ